MHTNRTFLKLVLWDSPHKLSTSYPQTPGGVPGGGPGGRSRGATTRPSALHWNIRVLVTLTAYRIIVVAVVGYELCSVLITRWTFIHYPTHISQPSLVKCPYQQQRKKVSNDYTSPNAPKSVLFNRLHTIHPLWRGSIPPLLRKAFRGARLLLLRVWSLWPLRVWSVTHWEFSQNVRYVCI